jgi:hypothetical protein
LSSPAARRRPLKIKRVFLVGLPTWRQQRHSSILKNASSTTFTNGLNCARPVPAFAVCGLLILCSIRARFHPLLWLSRAKPYAGHTMIKQDIIVNLWRFADNYAQAMIDE